MYKPVIVNVARALYNRHTMMPDSLRQVVGVQRLPSSGLIFHVRRANPKAQRMVQRALRGRLIFGGSVRR